MLNRSRSIDELTLRNIKGSKESGKINQNNLDKDTLDKLIIAKLAIQVLKEFASSNRSGYDNSGLVWETGNAVLYSLKHKTNMRTQEHTEWMMNSTAYPRKNEPF